MTEKESKMRYWEGYVKGQIFRYDREDETYKAFYYNVSGINMTKEEAQDAGTEEWRKSLDEYIEMWCDDDLKKFEIHDYRIYETDKDGNEL